MKLLLLIGTRKGAFIASAAPDRRHWTLTGPLFKGTEINQVAYDSASGTLAACGKSGWFGPVLQLSTDLGATWHEPAATIRFADDRGKSVDRIWTIVPDPRVPKRLYGGVDPGALFVSDDAGANWRELPGITDHPTRDRWSPGAGGLMVHSIACDRTRPSRMTVGISAAGAFRTDDGGESWTPKNAGVRADFMPDKFPEVGQCVHHMEGHPQKPDVLYQQNHCGVYRSDNAGDSWVDISEGLPSRFGFPLAVLPHEGDTIFVVPEEADIARTTPDGRFRIFRSRDRGTNWEALTQGLPQSNAFVNVMRMAMTTDTLDEPGVYLGTQGGQIVASRNGGDSWEVLFNWLPPVYGLQTALVE